jgi:hypothetical protein
MQCHKIPLLRQRRGSAIRDAARRVAGALDPGLTHVRDSGRTHLRPFFFVRVVTTRSIMTARRVRGGLHSRRFGLAALRV